MAIALITAFPVYSADFILPVDGPITSGYGPRWGRMHHGIDIAASVGTSIRAVADRVAEFVGERSGYGLVVELRHPDGSLTRYAHNSRNLVEQGDCVVQGEAIAEVGCTGNCTGPHMHFEVHLPNIGVVAPISYSPSLHITDTESLNHQILDLLD